MKVKIFAEFIGILVVITNENYMQIKEYLKKFTIRVLASK